MILFAARLRVMSVRKLKLQAGTTDLMKGSEGSVMTRKQRTISWTVILAVVGHGAMAFAQGSPFGGVGHVTTSPSSIDPGGSVQIQFQITGSLGTGTTPLTCTVTDPAGSVFTATRSGVAWSEGVASASFTYPNDFGGSLLSITTRTPGIYTIQCYWPISGYGVNGPTAAASGSFVVNNHGSPWGGVGQVTTSASAINAGDSVQIRYQITGSSGSGTTPLTCLVTDPAGSIFTATKNGVPWTSGGIASASFTYPSDFGGSLLAIATQSPGAYGIQCYWPISGSGVNGPTDAASASFEVVNPTGTVHGSQWGGVGTVITSLPSVSAGGSVQIQYQITGSGGSGSASFTCTATDPNGSVFTATRNGVAWSGGTGSTSFTYPSDFGGSLLSVNSATPGNYLIQCYWPISGYGVNGPVDAASASFNSQGNPWGGLGQVYTWPSSLNAGTRVQIGYNITSSFGTGTAPFTCTVTDPNGSVFSATRNGVAWSGYAGSALLTYPDDFGGSLLPINTLTPGNYAVHCSWPISGSGVNGSVDAASASLLVAGNRVVVTTTSLPSGTAGAAYSQTLTASSGTSPYTWSVISGTLPPGLSLSRAGVLSGTPSTSGTYDFTVEATDSVGVSGSAPLVLAIASSLVVTTTSPLPSGTIGAAYSQTMTASGGTPPYTWLVSSGTPPGLSFSSSGVLSGTPTTSGTYN